MGPQVWPLRLRLQLVTLLRLMAHIPRVPLVACFLPASGWAARWLCSLLAFLASAALPTHSGLCGVCRTLLRGTVVIHNRLIMHTVNEARSVVMEESRLFRSPP